MLKLLLIALVLFCIWLVFRIARVAIRLFAFLLGLAALVAVLYFVFVR